MADQRAHGGDAGGGPPSDQLRQRTIDQLCEAFANDELKDVEFERRIDLAHRADTEEELTRLLHGLRAQVPAPVERTVPDADAGGAGSISTAASVREWGVSAGILGGTHQRGHWIAARRNVALGMLGGCTLDFREAALPTGVTEVHAFAFCGGVEVIVPPGLRVETSGIGVMGGFEHVQDSPAPAAEGAPTLRISGLACMGAVEVKVRLPGESAREAKRRVRERRRARRLERGE